MRIPQSEDEEDVTDSASNANAPNLGVIVSVRGSVVDRRSMADEKPA